MAAIFERQIDDVMPRGNVTYVYDSTGKHSYPAKGDTSGRIITASGDGSYTTPTHTYPTIAAASTLVLAANTNRLYALVINDSDEVIYLALGVAAVMNRPIRLNASGGSYEMSKKLGNLYTGALYGICASGGKIALVTEGT